MASKFVPPLLLTKHCVNLEDNVMFNFYLMIISCNCIVVSTTSFVRCRCNLGVGGTVLPSHP